MYVVPRLRWAAAVFVTASIYGQSTSSIHVVAGTGWMGDGGPATSAVLVHVEGLAVDSEGNLYISDSDAHRVRKVAPGGKISTIAGTGIRGFSGDGGPAVEAQLNTPYGLATDFRGNVYVADLGNARLRRISPDGRISTIAGGGTIDAAAGVRATEARLAAPRNAALELNGTVYFSDFGAHRVYRIAYDGTLEIAAGDGGAGRLRYPAAVALDQKGVLFVADTQNHAVRQIERGVISTVARAATPTGLVHDRERTLWVADSGAGQILKITAGQPAGIFPAQARDIAVYRGLYLADGDRVTFLDENGAVRVAAGGGDWASGDGGDARSARLRAPAGVALDSAGNLYIADRGNHRVRKVAPDGTISTVPGLSEILDSPAALAVDASGNLAIADTGLNRIIRVTPAGVVSVESTAIPEPGPENLTLVALAANGDLYFAGSQTLRKISPGGAAEELPQNSWIAINEIGQAVLIPRIPETGWGAAIDAAGFIYVSETERNRVVRREPSAPVVVDPVRVIEVWNAATLRQSPVVPGMLLVLAGAAIAPEDRAAIRVEFSSIAAPVLASGGDRIYVEVPEAVAALAGVEIVIRVGEIVHARLSAPVTASAPGVFLPVANEDGTPNSETNPSARGSVITVYATGTGVAGSPLALRVGDYEAEILWAGPAPGYPGVIQINARIPAGYAPPGIWALVLKSGNAESQQGLRIATR